MSANIICILIAIVVYLVGMVAIGVYYSKGQSDAHEFYLGGRKLGPIVTALSTEASDMSAYLLMGVPGLAFFCGIAEASWTAIGLALGTYLNWLFVAKRLRRYSVRLGAVTLPEYISRRFGVSSTEQTSDETLRAMKPLLADQKDIYEHLRKMLTLADLVKFAKWTATPDENEQSLRNAYEFVRETTPVAAEDDKQQKEKEV